MIFRPASNVINALLLGFFCCLGSALAEDGEAKEKAAEVELLTLNAVHPESDELVPKIEKGETLPPAGFRLCEFPIIDYDTDKKVGTRKLLISRQNIVTETDVKRARGTNSIGEIAVLLTEEGGKRLAIATKKMTLGRDRLAVVLEGRGQIAPTVQAILGREFVTNGLDGKKEVERLVKALNAKPKGK